jgi:hypothetical protein
LQVRDSDLDYMGNNLNDKESNFDKHIDILDRFVYI